MYINCRVYVYERFSCWPINNTIMKGLFFFRDMQYFKIKEIFRIQNFVYLPLLFHILRSSWLMKYLSIEGWLKCYSIVRRFHSASHACIHTLRAVKGETWFSYDLLKNGYIGKFCMFMYTFISEWNFQHGKNDV